MAITVVPNDLAGLESVLAQAREAGIIVVSHEAVGIENVDIDIEAFENKAYGARSWRTWASAPAAPGSTCRWSVA